MTRQFLQNLRQKSDSQFSLLIIFVDLQKLQTGLNIARYSIEFNDNRNQNIEFNRVIHDNLVEYSILYDNLSYTKRSQRKYYLKWQFSVR